MRQHIPALTLLALAACAPPSSGPPLPPADISIEETAAFTDTETGQEYLCVTTSANLTECSPTGPASPAP